MKEKSEVLNLFDFGILISVLLLTAAGILFIFSARFTSKGIINDTQYLKQIFFACLGLGSIIIIVFLDYRRIKRYSFYLYLGLLLILIITRLVSKKVNGAHSWLGIGSFGVQPSEFGKIIFIFYLAKFLEDSKNDSGLSRFIIGNAIMLLPMALILIQPDLGTASVYFPIFLVMAFMAGVPARFLVFELSFLLLTLLFATLPVYNRFIPDVPYKPIMILGDFKLRIVLIISCGSVSIISAVIRSYFHGKKYFYWISYTFLCITVSLILSMFAQKILTGLSSTHPNYEIAQALNEKNAKKLNIETEDFINIANGKVSEIELNVIASKAGKKPEKISKTAKKKYLSTTPDSRIPKFTAIKFIAGDLLKHPSKWLEFPENWNGKRIGGYWHDGVGYQMKRLIIFTKPEYDRQGAGWNIYQSKIAIGAGMLTGRGVLQGTQSHNGWLPEQSTDFIFGILSEEFGFIGALTVLLLYLFLFIRIILIIRHNHNIYGTYIASGILATYAFHFFINIGMLMGMMPCTGIPLLFLSYGGSSLLTAMICAGILMNINYFKKELH
ncbi:MAG: rod shape-determining protein RodA [Treponema sp.]|nr:rod shape-determining protein RodA [Treponema sp.]